MISIRMTSAKQPVPSSYLLPLYFLAVTEGVIGLSVLRLHQDVTIIAT